MPIIPPPTDYSVKIVNRFTVFSPGFPKKQNKIRDIKSALISHTVRSRLPTLRLEERIDEDSRTFVSQTFIEPSIS